MNQFAIEILLPDEINRLAPLLRKSTKGPYRFLAHEMRDELNHFWLDTIVALVQTKNALVLVALDKGILVGCLIYTDNPWESHTLGRKAGVINHLIVSESLSSGRQIAGELLDSLFLWAKSHEVQFILCKPYTDSVEVIQACETRGFLLVDALLDCIYDYRRFPIQEIIVPEVHKDVSIRLAEPLDMEELMVVAGSAFRLHFGRFHSDEKIGRDSATRVYQEWI